MTCSKSDLRFKIGGCIKKWGLWTEYQGRTVRPSVRQCLDKKIALGQLSSLEKQLIQSVNTVEMHSKTHGHILYFGETLAQGSNRNWFSYLQGQSDFRFLLLHWLRCEIYFQDGNMSQTHVAVENITFELALACSLGIPHVHFRGNCFPNGWSLGLSEVSGVWLLICWNPRWWYSWDHSNRSVYCVRDW